MDVEHKIVRKYTYNERKSAMLDNRRIMVIGFCGAAKSGKDSAANAFADSLKACNVLQKKFAFADPIRSIAGIFGFSDQVLNDQACKEHWAHPWLTEYSNGKNTPVTPRRFMQLVGSEMFRNVLHPNVWVDFLASKIDDLDRELNDENYMHGYKLCEETRQDVWSPKAVVLISDVRFPNEAEMIHKRGGYIIRITRNTQQDKTGEWRKHESEKFVNELPVDLGIFNSASSLIDWRGKSVRDISEFLRNEKVDFTNSVYNKVIPV